MAKPLQEKEKVRPESLQNRVWKASEKSWNDTLKPTLDALAPGRTEKATIAIGGTLGVLAVAGAAAAQVSVLCRCVAV